MTQDPTITVAPVKLAVCKRPSRGATKGQLVRAHQTKMARKAARRRVPAFINRRNGAL